MYLGNELEIACEDKSNLSIVKCVEDSDYFERSRNIYQVSPRHIIRVELLFGIPQKK